MSLPNAGLLEFYDILGDPAARPREVAYAQEENIA